MRMLMNVSIPNHTFNAAVKDGSVGPKLARILEAIKPEAVYFTEQNGVRGAVLIVDLPDAAKIPGWPSRGFSPLKPRSSSASR